VAPSATRTPISRSLAHHVGDDPVQSHRGQRQGEGAEHAHERGEETRRGGSGGDLVLHRNDLEDRLARQHLVDRSAHRPREPRRVAVGAHDERDVQALHHPLRHVRHVAGDRVEPRAAHVARDALRRYAAA
jgi:hypothetical protein